MLKVTNVLPHSATKPPAISPLADPIVEAIFIDEVSAGLAAASLVDAVLKKDGVRIGQILKVTPQRSHKQPSERGCRVDVEITTDANERVLVEVQLYSDRYILQRNLFSASAIFAETSNPGDTSYELAKNMPRVISINLLNVNIRDVKENSEYLQPVKLQYVKPPHSIAISQFLIYNIQLPCFREQESDFDDALYCWLYAMDTAAQKNMNLEEVIQMTPQLQDFRRADAGFQQFCDLYKRAIADPALRQEYHQWCLDRMREEGMRDAAIEEGIEKGHVEERVDIAKNLIANGFTDDVVSELTKLTIDEVQALHG